MNCCAGETARICCDLNILGPVSVFPNFDEYNGAVESIEDEKRKGQTGDDSPRQKSIKRKMQFLCHPVVCHERVEQPQRNVSEKKESNNLSAGFEEHLVS